MQASYGYSESKGRATRMFSQYQGRVFWGAVEGTDPNHHVNGEGLQQGDRKHIFQAQGNFDLPWELDASTMIRWMSGRAHSRLATVVDLNQGTTTVTMDAANDSLRLPSRFLLDFTLGRSFPLGAGTALRFDVQVFNILNEDAWDWWEEDAYERGQFVPEIYALPRRVMLRLAFDF
jgi:hypothetical protein